MYFMIEIVFSDSAYGSLSHLDDGLQARIVKLLKSPDEAMCTKLVRRPRCLTVVQVMTRSWVPVPVRAWGGCGINNIKCCSATTDCWLDRSQRQEVSLLDDNSPHRSSLLLQARIRRGVAVAGRDLYRKWLDL